ncbi:MAG TPA: phosphohydrolase [Solibacterales bacterium]|nr:phosphohydrolase [Bryobacterales bacterium]
MPEAARAREIVDQLKGRGHQAYFVGGCVRDLLLGIAPKDYDVATDARPAELLRMYPHAAQVGAHFGVVLVDGVEVATFRSDAGYSDGRRPDQVVFESGPREDALRRDFTINGLFLEPDTGEVLDFATGRADLAAGLIRAIGDPDKRFAEDHLRLLRAVRFAARFRFSIEPVTFSAIERLASRIADVSAERVRDELNRILTEGGARYGFELLDATGLLAYLLPEVKRYQGVEQPPEYHPEGDVWTHTMLMLEAMDHPSVPLAWGVLLHDCGKPDTFVRADRIRFNGHVEQGIQIARGILRRLRFSNEEAAQIEALIAHHMQFKDVPNMRQSTLKRFLRLPRFDEHMALHYLDVAFSNRNFSSHQMVEQKLQELGHEQLKPAPLLTGNDLIAAGYTPGPQFAKWLELVEDAQLEGRVSTAEEALELIRGSGSS